MNISTATLITQVVNTTGYILLIVFLFKVFKHFPKKI